MSNNRTKTLTKTQITNLLGRAYGFVDQNGVLFTTDTYLIDSYDFCLDSAGSTVVFSYDNATFADGVVTFEAHDGDTESFTVLVAAVANNCNVAALID